MKKFFLLTLTLGLCLVLFGCTEVDTDTDTATETESNTDTEFDTDSDTDTESESETDVESDAESDTESDTDSDTDTESESETDAESDTESDTDSDTGTESESETDAAPAALPLYDSEGVVFDAEHSTFSYRVVSADVQRAGGISLEITVIRKETAETYNYEGSTTLSEPFIRIEHIAEDGTRTDVTEVITTEDEITRTFQPGETIVSTVWVGIPADAPAGDYGLTLSHVSSGSVWIENAFYLD